TGLASDSATEDMIERAEDLVGAESRSPGLRRPLAVVPPIRDVGRAIDLLGRGGLQLVASPRELGAWVESQSDPERALGQLILESVTTPARSHPRPAVDRRGGRVDVEP